MQSVITTSTSLEELSTQFIHFESREEKPKKTDIFSSNGSKEPWKSNSVLNVLVNHLLCGSFHRNTGVKLIMVKFKALHFGKYLSKIIETLIICWYQNSLYKFPSSIKPITFIEYIPSAQKLVT